MTVDQQLEPAPALRSPRQAAGAGALAALAGLVAAEVFALVLPGRPSPVISGPRIGRWSGV